MHGTMHIKKSYSFNFFFKFTLQYFTSLKKFLKNKLVKMHILNNNTKFLGSEK